MRKTSQYYEQDRRRGRLISAGFHLLFLVIAIVGLPSFFEYMPPDEPSAITVEVLPITGVTNVRPQEKEPEPEPKPAEKKPEAKPSPPVKTAEATPPPPPAPVTEPKKAEKKPEEKKPEPKKPEKKKAKPKEDDLDAILRAVKETAQKEKADKEKKDKGSQSKSISNQYNPDLPMSLSEKDAIRSQIAKCWNVPAGAKNAHELIVVLRIELEKDGSLIKVELADESKSRYDRDSFFRTAADSAIRAVRQCSPIKNLPPEKFQTWRDIELTFDPREMLF